MDPRPIFRIVTDVIAKAVAKQPPSPSEASIGTYATLPISQALHSRVGRHADMSIPPYEPAQCARIGTRPVQLVHDCPVHRDVRT